VLEGGAALFDRVLVHDSSYGLWIQHAPGASVTNVISRNNDTGIYVLSSSLALENVTVSQNTLGLAAGSGGGVATAIALSNSIFANNTPQFKLGSNVTLSVSYSDVWPAAPDNAHLVLGAGALSVDPGFAGAPEDLHLLPASACIDAGSSAASSDHDFDRNARPLDGNRDGKAAPDLGAYELFFRAFCGDGKVDAGEVCDDGDANGAPGRCREDCAGSDGAAGAAGASGHPGGGGSGLNAGAENTPSGGMPNTSNGGAEDASNAGAGDTPNGGAAEPSDEPAGMGGTHATMPPTSRGGSTATAPSGGSPGMTHEGSRPPAGSGGLAGRGGTGAAPSEPAAEGGEAPAVATCVPGAQGVCTCPDRTRGTLVCTSERVEICYCAAAQTGGESTPSPAASDGCGCRLAPQRGALEDWSATLSLGALAVALRFPRRSRRSGRP
jgi:hypothetical protein